MSKKYNNEIIAEVDEYFVIRNGNQIYFVPTNKFYIPDETKEYSIGDKVDDFDEWYLSISVRNYLKIAKILNV